MIGVVLRHDLRQIDAQDIPLHQRKIIVLFHRHAQNGQKIAVDLHRGHMPAPRGQNARHIPRARADLQNRVLRTHAGFIHQRFQQRRVGQKILPQAVLMLKLAGLAAMGRTLAILLLHAFPSNARQARTTAAGSSARSSAVPITSASAPAATVCAAVSALMPPSTMICPR